MSKISLKILFLVFLTYSICKGQTLSNIIEFKTIEKILTDRKEFKIYMLDNGFLHENSDENGEYWCLPKYQYGKDCKEAKISIQYDTWDDNNKKYGFIMFHVEKEYFPEESTDVITRLKKYYPLRDIEETERASTDIKTGVTTQEDKTILLHYSSDRRYKAQILNDGFYQFGLVLSCEGEPHHGY